jgi:hypothetical protein
MNMYFVKESRLLQLLIELFELSPEKGKSPKRNSQGALEFHSTPKLN